MNVGAAQADVAVLVVNATNGEFETGFDAGGQTREHTMLARSLGNLSVYLPSYEDLGLCLFCGRLQFLSTVMSVCLSVRLQCGCL